MLALLDEARHGFKLSKICHLAFGGSQTEKNERLVHFSVLSQPRNAQNSLKVAINGSTNQKKYLWFRSFQVFRAGVNCQKSLELGPHKVLGWILRLEKEAKCLRFGHSLVLGHTKCSKLV